MVSLKNAYVLRLLSVGTNSKNSVLQNELISLSNVFAFVGILTIFAYTLVLLYVGQWSLAILNVMFSFITGLIFFLNHRKYYLTAKIYQTLVIDLVFSVSVAVLPKGTVPYIAYLIPLIAAEQLFQSHPKLKFYLGFVLTSILCFSQDLTRHQLVVLVDNDLEIVKTAIRVLLWAYSFFLIRRWSISINSLQTLTEKQTAELTVIVDGLSEGVVLQDQEGNILRANPAANLILGLNKDQMIGRNTKDPRWNAIRPDGTEFASEDLPAIMTLKTGLPQKDIMYGIQKPTGEYTWISAGTNPIFQNGLNRPSHVLVTFRNVTEEILLAKQLHHEKSRFQTLFEMAPVGILLLDSQMRYVQVNRAYQKMLGYKSAELIGKTIFDVTFNDDIEITAAAATLAKNADAGSIDIQRFKQRQLSKEGKIVWAQVTASPIQFQGDSETYMFSIIEDITEIVTMDETLKHEREQLEQYFTISQDMLGILDMSGYFIRVNPKFFEVFGYSDSELLSKTIFSLVDIESIELAKNEFEYLKTGKVNLKFETGCIRKNGQKCKIEWAISTSEKDKVAYFSARDVTEEREKELQLLQRSKLSSLGEMSAGIAHEINNPLGIIKGKAQQITRRIEENEIDKAQLLSYSRVIDKTADRISKIVSGLKSFARDGSKDPFADASLRQICEETIGYCSARFMSHRVTLNFVPGLIDINIDCRSSQISQVLLNLLNNAFDAISKLDAKWITLEILDRDNFVEIRVIDSGHGIPKDIQHKILQPFFTTKPVGEGTGLGLSIVRGIIKDHGGMVEIDNASSNTCFKVVLPKRQMQSVA